MTEILRFFTTLLDAAGSLYPGNRLPDRPAILVHSALSGFGRVEGGADAVAETLSAACASRNATLVLPSHGGDDASAMGQIAESFRKMKGVGRSGHPELAFCASGPLARRILKNHRPEYGLGEKSPVGRLYGFDALVLMLGTGWDTCTVMHLAEYRKAEKARADGTMPDMVTCWYRGKTWKDLAYHTECFPDAGADFEREHPEKVRSGPMPGNGKRAWKLLRVRDIVDFCVDTCTYLR